MSKESQLVNTLTLESEKIDTQLLPKLRISLPNYEVSAWDNNMATSYSQFDSYVPRVKNHSVGLSRKASLSPMLETKQVCKKDTPKLKNSPTPLAYKIATIALNEFQSFTKDKKLKRL